MAQSTAWITQPWTPLNLGNLVLWIRASDTPGGDGQNLGLIRDLSGNGHHFHNETVAQQPILKLAQINGKSAFQFDGTKIISCDTFVFGGQQYSAFFVMRLTSTGVLMSYFERSTDPNNSANAGWSDSILAANNPSTFFKGDVGYSEFDSNAVTETTSYHRIINSCDISLATNETLVRYDDTKAGTYPFNNNNGNSFNVTQQLFLGARSGLINPLFGYVAELAVTSATSSDAELTLWHTYVTMQYGI